MYLHLTPPLKNPGVAKVSRIYLALPCPALVADSIQNSKTPPAVDTLAILRECKTTKTKNTPMIQRRLTPPPGGALLPDSGSWPLFTGLRTHTHTIRQDTSGWLDSSSQRRLPHNTHNNHNRHPCPPPLGGIRTRNHSKRADADQRLRPRGHWDRLRL
jgi:hypothetical protein